MELEQRQSSSSSSLLPEGGSPEGYSDPEQPLSSRSDAAPVLQDGLATLLPDCCSGEGCRAPLSSQQQRHPPSSPVPPFAKPEPGEACLAPAPLHPKGKEHPPPLRELRSEDGCCDPKEPPSPSSPRPKVVPDVQVPAVASATKLADEATVGKRSGRDMSVRSVPVLRRVRSLFSFAGRPSCRCM